MDCEFGKCKRTGLLMVQHIDVNPFDHISNGFIILGWLVEQLPEFDMPLPQLSLNLFPPSLSGPRRGGVLRRMQIHLQWIQATSLTHHCMSTSPICLFVFEN